MSQFETLYTKNGEIAVCHNDKTGRYDLRENDKVVFSDVRADVVIARHNRFKRESLDLPEGVVTLKDVIDALHVAKAEANPLLTLDDLVKVRAVADSRLAEIAKESARVAAEQKAKDEAAVLEFAGVVTQPVDVIE